MLTSSPATVFKFHDDEATRLMGLAYAIACKYMEAEGDEKSAVQLRAEIAAALIEAADDAEIESAETLAENAIRLVYVDQIEIDFT